MGSNLRGISASRGAAVLGLSEYMTPFTVWQEICEEREPGFNAKRGYILPEKPDNAAMRWGTAFESAVIELAERGQGKKITGREILYACNDINENGKPVFSLEDMGDINFITCHIDGYYDCPKNEYPPILHEGKTTNARSFFRKPNDPDDFNNMWGTPGTGHIPRVYQVQVQHQMLCTGAGEAIVSVLIFPETPDAWEKMGWVIEEKPTAYGGTYHILYHKVKHKKDGTLMGFIKPSEWANTLADMGYFHQYPVKANPEAQRMMVERYREFWHKHVLAGIPPEPRDYDDIKRLFVEPVGTIVCDAAMTAWWREYDAIRKEIGQSGAAAKRQAKLKLRILNQARKLNPVMDDESQEKIIFRDSSGNKLGQYSLKGGFR